MSSEHQLQKELTGLRLEAERYKSALDGAGDGVWDWNLVTGELFFSENWKTMLGYSSEEIQASFETWKSLVHPDDLDAALEDISRCVNGQTPGYENEHRLRCKDGSYKWILDRGKIIESDPQGKPVRFIGTHTNINRRKLLEKELARSNQAIEHTQDLLNYIIEHSNGSVAVHDRDMRYIYVSQRYLRDYKISDPDVIGKHHYEVFPDLPQKWRDVHQRVLKGEALKADRDPYPREDGTTEWTRWECLPWYEVDGSIGGLIVYTEVITDYIRAEQIALESEAKYRSLFENMALASCVDEIILENGRPVDYRIIEVNAAFEEIIGLKKEEVSGQLASVAYGTGQAPFIDIYGEVALTGKPASFEAWFEPIQKHLQVTASCPKPGFFSTVFSDITARRQMETELSSLKEKLEQEVAQKTAELRERVSELEKFHQATIEREFRMKELRDEIDRIKAVRG